MAAAPAETELSFQRCAACGLAIHPARTTCPRCGGRELARLVSTGRGTVYAVTVVHRRDERYDVALVDVEEGFRVMTEVVDVDPERVRIGMAVRARPDPATADRAARVVFAPADG